MKPLSVKPLSECRPAYSTFLPLVYQKRFAETAISESLRLDRAVFRQFEGSVQRFPFQAVESQPLVRKALQAFLLSSHRESELGNLCSFVSGHGVPLNVPWTLLLHLRENLELPG